MVNHVAMSEMTKACDEREEGEIIDDDLEDVSDSSMFPSSPLDSGKSVSPELLSAVCLSSVSSTDYCRPCGRGYYQDSFPYNKWKQRKKRKEYNFKRRNNYVKHHRQVSVEIESESDNELVDPKYAKQLKEALKHETPQELHNSLRTRLKAFINPISPHSDEASITALHDMALLTTLQSTSAPHQNDNSNIDKSNKNLIVENFEDSELYELRMAALKSVVLEKHKQRKRKKGDCSDIVCVEDVDKENDQSVINNDTKNQDSGTEEVINKEDPVGELQPENSANDSVNVMEDDVDILRAMLLASMTKTLSTKFPVSSGIVNTAASKHEMLKSEQRKTLAKHAIVNPLIINVNADSDSDMETFGEENKSLKETVTEFLKKQRAEVEENLKKNDSLNKSDDFFMDKSVMRLLPHSQQLEYRQLKQRLLNARKKTRLRRTSQRISENGGFAKKVPKVKNVDASGSNNVNPNINGKVKSVQERKNIQPNLQKTLNELQIRKNGRLQMKGKYRPLGVLLHKINHASNVRRQHELEIKKLLHEIQKARVKLAMSHQNFTNLVQQLIKEKQVIDQSVFKNSVPFTSTPKRVINKQLKKVNVKESRSTNSSNEPKIVKEEEEKILLEPNDVTKVFVQQVDVLKYTSPLDNNRDTNKINDPLTTLCPYDLLGTCKDKECKYVHYS
ncbi:hypothetical protein RN001_002698 [Aquatica leii]|uniref:Putative zinc-finger domain-containing protein n=1 Tax=Aquatica leii TaxID=1421715 RepID=A0AAN7SKB3_9COLE|nr:hypothetical protein RN001_002698 [Aquatica leii]